MATINLNELTHGKVRNLTGHERGAAARLQFNLDAFDKEGAPINVQVPDDLEGITTSFFQGMFAKSVRSAQNRFLEQYRFHASPAIMEQILRGIDRVNTRRGMALA